MNVNIYCRGKLINSYANTIVTKRDIEESIDIRLPPEYENCEIIESITQRRKWDLTHVKTLSELSKLSQLFFNNNIYWPMVEITEELFETHLKNIRPEYHHILYDELSKNGYVEMLNLCCYIKKETKCPLCGKNAR